MLRKIFGPKRNKLTGDWRRLHIGGLCNLQFSPNIIWVTKYVQMGGACGTFAEKRSGLTLKP
jgi:hypothetical protein